MLISIILILAICVVAGIIVPRWQEKLKKPFIKKTEKWWLFLKREKLIILAVLLFIIAIWALLNLEVFACWLGLSIKSNDLNPRDIGLLFGGLLAPGLAMLGFYFSDHRNQAMLAQVKVDFDRNLNENFMTTIEMLSDKVEYKQLSSIASLRQINFIAGNQFSQATASALASFIRNHAPPLKDITSKVSEKVQFAFYVLCEVQANRNLSHSREYANLDKINLSGLQAANSIIRYISLRHVNLTGADISNSTISDINLTYANFTTANLIAVNFSGSNLKGADFNGAHLRRAKFSGADLIGAKFPLADIKFAEFSGADLTNTDFCNSHNVAVKYFEEARWDFNQGYSVSLPEKLLEYHDKEEMHVDIMCSYDNNDSKQLDDQIEEENVGLDSDEFYNRKDDYETFIFFG